MYCRPATPIITLRDSPRRKLPTSGRWVPEVFLPLPVLCHAAAGPASTMIALTTTLFLTALQHMRAYTASQDRADMDSNYPRSSGNGWLTIFSRARNQPIWSTLPLIDSHGARRYALRILRACWVSVRGTLAQSPRSARVPRSADQ